MKLILTHFLLFLACFSSAAAQSWRDNRAQLCFVRPEDNGGINALQSWVRIGDYEVPLIGGQAACLYVDSGANELIVTSTIPYEPSSKNPRACKSKPMKLSLLPNEKRTFTIRPATKSDEYICGWQIQSTPN